MSEYKFKNLSEINTVAEPAEGTTMMGFEKGVPIQMPMKAVKGSGGVFIINPDDPEYSTTDTAYGNKVKEALLNGKTVWLYDVIPATTTTNALPYDVQAYAQVIGFAFSENTSGHHVIMLHDSDNQAPQIFRITVD